MQLYYVNGPTARCSYEATREEAHRKLKAAPRRGECYIDLIEVDTDKAGVLAILNRDPDTNPFGKVLRSWDLTHRGGLRELSPQELADALAQ